MNTEPRATRLVDRLERLLSAPERGSMSAEETWLMLGMTVGMLVAAFGGVNLCLAYVSNESGSLPLWLSWVLVAVPFAALMIWLVWVLLEDRQAMGAP
jgi:hypothetical protein